jgi:predicted enzyme related to lactoylglutathione lyase
MPTAINWFEIPVANLDRAQAFYEKLLGRTLKREDFGGTPMAVFPYEQPATGGCLAAGAHRAAESGSGIRIYLDCMPSIDAALSRAVAAGGQIVAPKSELPAGMGFIAHLRDTEGNEIGLHAMA